jgi:hypothetical protein
VSAASAADLRPSSAASSAVALERHRASIMAAMSKDGPGRVVRVVERRRGKDTSRWRIDFGRKIQPRYLDSYNGARMETEALAHAFLTLIRHECAKGRPLQDVVAEVGPSGGDGPAIEPLLEEWVVRFRRRVEIGDRSANSLAELERWAKPGGHLSWWFGASLFTVDRASLEEWDLWLAERELGAKTRRNVMAAFRSFCTWAKERRPTFEIPRFPWPEPDEYVPRVVSLDVQAQILAAIPDARRGIFLALARLGLRPSEARVARIVDWRGDELRIHRGAKDRRVGGREGGTKKRRGSKLLPIPADPADLREWLERHVPPELRLAEPEGYLFRNPDGERGQWGPTSMTRAWRAACDQVGVRVSLYEGTKHSFGTAAKAAGVEDRVLAHIFGHSDTRSVARYGRLELDTVRSALGRLPRAPRVLRAEDREEKPK